MKLIPTEYERYNPVLVLMGMFFIVAGSFGLFAMGISGPLVLWLLRGIPAMFVAIGVVIVLTQIKGKRDRDSY